METPLVSVIVPIYKVEAYLDQCIQSVAEQSYQNLEIILVDDGSPDRCPQICDRWAQRDNRIQVVHKMNGGVSDARNMGISLASGSYLIMPDGDDYLLPDMIETMVNYAQKYQAQCVIGGYKRLLRDGTLLEKPGTDTVVVCDDKGKVEKNILCRLVGAEYKKVRPLSQSVCMKLYDRKLVAEAPIMFLSVQDIGSEDFYFNICVFERIERAVIIPETSYIYRDNKDSCSNTYRQERIDSFVRLYREMEQKALLLDKKSYLEMLSANILGEISVCIKLLVASKTPDKMNQLTSMLERGEIRRMLFQCRLSKIRFPLSLFCFLLKYRMKYTLVVLISLFLNLT